MADRKPILVRFEGDWLLARVDAFAGERKLSRNAAILHLLTVAVGVGDSLEAAGSPGMASGPEGVTSANGTSSSAAGTDPPAAGEGASKAEPPRTVPQADRPAGTEAPRQVCDHGVARGFFCRPCQGRVE